MADSTPLPHAHLPGSLDDPDHDNDHDHDHDHFDGEPSPAMSLSPSRSTSPTVLGKRPLSVDEAPQVPAMTVPSPVLLNATVPKLSSAPQNPAPTKKVLERNQACLGCRQRKRKCDGKKPACGACDRLERDCVYTSPAVTKIHGSSYRHYPSPSSQTQYRQPSPPPSTTSRSPPTLIPVQPSPIHSAFTAINRLPNGGVRNFHEPPRSGMPELDTTVFAAGFFTFSPFIGLDPIEFSTISNASTDSPEPSLAAQIALDENELPSLEYRRVLYELFFDKIHVLLPMLYRKRFLKDVAGSSTPSCLTYAMLAIAAHVSPDAALKSLSGLWLGKAKDCLKDAYVNGRYSLNAVQGGLYILLLQYGLGQMSEVWILMSDIYRLCLPLGLNAIDAPAPHFKGYIAPAKSEQETEERRRTMWGVYVVERTLTFTTGWGMVIQDSDFCVNYPAPESQFQSGDLETIESVVVDPFRYGLEHLAIGAAEGDAFRWLCKLSVLLGRIHVFNTSLHTDTTAFTLLENALVRITLIMPRPIRQLSPLPAAERELSVHVHLLINVCKILLYHPRAVACKDSSEAADAYSRCTTSVEDVLKGIKSLPLALGLNDDTVLTNPLLGPALFLIARIEVERVHAMSASPSFQTGGSILCAIIGLRSGIVNEEASTGIREGAPGTEGVELVMGVYRRIEEVWPQLAGKFLRLMKADMKREFGSALRGKAEGDAEGGGLLGGVSGACRLGYVEG